jgi:two-component system, OmpR family, response regulator RegX3
MKEDEMRIAILEDSVNEANALTGWLRDAGHVTVLLSSGNAFIKEVACETYDLLIVGTRASAIYVLRWLREKHRTSVPVLRIIQNNIEHDVVASLRAGADDCMAMPMRHAEFLARVEALARRSPSVANRAQVLSYGELCVDLKNRVILRDGKRISLTPKSYDLAVYLLSNRGQLLARSHLMEHIWGRGNTSTRTLDTHVSRLRSELGLMPDNGWLLQSVYQHGYRLEQIEKLEARAA